MHTQRQTSCLAGHFSQPAVWMLLSHCFIHVSYFSILFQLAGMSVSEGVVSNIKINRPPYVFYEILYIYIGRKTNNFVCVA